jgi:hypothetical protein
LALINNESGEWGTRESFKAEGDALQLISQFIPQFISQFISQFFVYSAEHPKAAWWQPGGSLVAAWWQPVAKIAKDKEAGHRAARDIHVSLMLLASASPALHISCLSMSHSAIRWFTGGPLVAEPLVRITYGR